MPAALARCIVVGMVVLAIVVQIGVWGATKLHADGGALLALWMIAGKSQLLTVDSGLALTAGMGALMLAAGLLEGHLVPGTLRRVDGETDHGARWRVKARGAPGNRDSTALDRDTVRRARYGRAL